MTIKKTIGVFLLLLIFVFAINAQPQSFYISSGQTIKNGDIVRGYCLEYTKDELNMDNIYELSRIIGEVTVKFTNGLSILTTLQLLKDEGYISFEAFDSYQHLRFIFNSNNIVELRIGDNGISLLRKTEEMKNYEEEMVFENIQKIRELESQNVNRSLIQQECWNTWKDIKIVEGNIVTINYRASNPDKQVNSRFGNSSTVSHARNGNLFLRTDGILNSTEIFNEGITELNTHPHIDHISRRALETRLQRGDFERIISSYPINNSAKTKVFKILNKVEKNQNYNFRHENGILEITKNRPTNIFTGTIGDFYYTSYDYDKDIQVETFKYQKPIKSNANSDGVIYLITINKVKFLLFGDFDYPKGIENLLDASKANAIERADKEEEQYALFVRYFEAEKTVNQLAYQVNTARTQNVDTSRLTRQYNEALKNFKEIEENIEELETELLSLPVVKANVIKYPHHAFIFEKKDWGLIDRIDKELNPEHIIYQTRNNRQKNNFDAFLDSLTPTLRNKFINSAEKEVNFLTMKQFYKIFNNFIRNEGEAA